MGSYFDMSAGWNPYGCFPPYACSLGIMRKDIQTDVTADTMNMIINMKMEITCNPSPVHQNKWVLIDSNRTKQFIC